MVFDSGLLGIVQRASDAAEQVHNNIHDAADLLIELVNNPTYVRFGRFVLGAKNDGQISLYSVTPDASGPGYAGIHMTSRGIRVVPGPSEQIVECGWGADSQTNIRWALYNALGVLSAKRPLPAKDALDAEFAVCIEAYIETHHGIRVAEPDAGVLISDAGVFVRPQ